MPELPEVETIRRGLLKLIKGKTIARVTVYYPPLIQCPADIDLGSVLPGAAVTDILRRGKYLIFLLDNDWALVLHLRMTGQIFPADPDKPRDKHIHAVFDFVGGPNLYYRDQRKFGRIILMPQKDLPTFTPLAKLGPEPLSGLTAEEFKSRLAKRKGKIKAVLLDQRVLAGLGNIYADEALHRAGIHPERVAQYLTPGEIEALYRAVQEVLRLGIDHQGTTINTYVNADGESGEFQKLLRVYGKKGQPCAVCGTPITKIEVGGRGTHFCPRCQPENNRREIQ